MKKVFVFGSLNMDLVISAPYMPQKGETMHGGGFFTNPGGKGANQAVACGKMGADIHMGGALGDDAFGRTLADALTASGVDTSAIRTIPGCSSGVAVILVVEGDNRIILDGGANLQVTEADVDRLLEKAEAGDVFLCQLENPLDVVGYALQTAQSKGMYVILNPAPMNAEVKAYLPHCDMLILNETEFTTLCQTSVEVGSRSLLDIGISSVVLTLGEKGYCHAIRGQITCEEGIPVKAVDTTAAGDTFCGVVAACLARGQSVEEALRFANKAAAITVTRRGAQQSIPTYQEALEA